MNHPFGVLKMFGEPARLAEIDGVGRTETLARFDRIEHRNLMAVGEELAHDELAEAARAAGDDDAHFSRPAVRNQPDCSSSFSSELSMNSLAFASRASLPGVRLRISSTPSART